MTVSVLCVRACKHVWMCLVQVCRMNKFALAAIGIVSHASQSCGVVPKKVSLCLLIIH